MSSWTPTNVVVTSNSELRRDGRPYANRCKRKTSPDAGGSTVDFQDVQDAITESNL